MTPTEIADTLERDILSGTMRPGDPLNQVALAARFGVSRIPVRDALAQLVTKGVITAAPNKTATVLELDRDAVIELYDLRMMLECDLIARAVPLMTPADLAEIETALERSSAEAHQDNWARGDAMFHAALYAPAGRARQSAMVEELRRAARVQTAAYDQLTGKTARWLQEHAAIVGACKTGQQKQAQRMLRRHLRGARNLLLRAMAE